MVLRVPLVELLPSGLPDLWMRGHEDARAGAVAARLPRAFGARDASLLVELCGRLSEVPDVAALVLRVPVGRALVERPAQVELVLDGDTRCTVDRLRPVGHLDDVA